MKSMDDYLNEDITFDDSPRRRGSRDFDDTTSQISTITSASISNNSTPDVAPVAKPKALPRKSETRSMLKQGVDSVINTFKIFNTKPKLNVSSNNSVSSISSESINNQGNVSLIVEEIVQKVDESLTEFNIANLTRERTATINDELQKDPKYMDKMFDQLTKTLDEPEIHVSKNNKDASLEKFINPIEYELDETDEAEEAFGVAIVDEEVEEIGKKKESINVPQNDDENNSRQEDDDVELDDGNLNKLLPLDAISNKKKRKPKKK
jgi:hypothetical protein